MDQEADTNTAANAELLQNIQSAVAASGVVGKVEMIQTENGPMTVIFMDDGGDPNSASSQSTAGEVQYVFNEGSEMQYEVVTSDEPATSFVNSVDTVETAPAGAVSSETILFTMPEGMDSQTAMDGLETTISNQTAIDGLETTIPTQTAIDGLETTISSQTAMDGLETTISSQPYVVDYGATIPSSPAVKTEFTAAPYITDYSAISSLTNPDSVSETVIPFDTGQDAGISLTGNTVFNVQTSGHGNLASVHASPDSSPEKFTATPLYKTVSETLRSPPTARLVTPAVVRKKVTRQIFSSQPSNTSVLAQTLTNSTANANNVNLPAQYLADTSNVTSLLNRPNTASQYTNITPRTMNMQGQPFANINAASIGNLGVKGSYIRRVRPNQPQPMVTETVVRPSRITRQEELQAVESILSMDTSVPSVFSTDDFLQQTADLQQPQQTTVQADTQKLLSAQQTIIPDSSTSMAQQLSQNYSLQSQVKSLKSGTIVKTLQQDSSSSTPSSRKFIYKVIKPGQLSSATTQTSGESPTISVRSVNRSAVSVSGASPTVTTPAAPTTQQDSQPKVIHLNRNTVLMKGIQNELQLPQGLLGKAKNVTVINEKGQIISRSVSGTGSPSVSVQGRTLTKKIPGTGAPTTIGASPNPDTSHLATTRIHPRTDTVGMTMLQTGIATPLLPEALSSGVSVHYQPPMTSVSTATVSMPPNPLTDIGSGTDSVQPMPVTNIMTSPAAVQPNPCVATSTIQPHQMTTIGANTSLQEEEKISLLASALLNEQVTHTTPRVSTTPKVIPQPITNVGAIVEQSRSVSSIGGPSPIPLKQETPTTPHVVPKRMPIPDGLPVQPQPGSSNEASPLPQKQETHTSPRVIPKQIPIPSGLSVQQPGATLVSKQVTKTSTPQVQSRLVTSSGLSLLPAKPGPTTNATPGPVAESKLKPPQVEPGASGATLPSGSTGTEANAAPDQPGQTETPQSDIQTIEVPDSDVKIQIYGDGTLVTCDDSGTNYSKISLESLGLTPNLLKGDTNVDLVIVQPDGREVRASIQTNLQALQKSVQSVQGGATPSKAATASPRLTKVARESGTGVPDSLDTSVNLDTSVDTEISSTVNDMGGDLPGKPDSRPFKCMYCPRTFKFEKTFKCHEVVHKSDVIFTCPICKRVFAREENLKTHLDLHEKISHIKGKVTKTASMKNELKQAAKLPSDQIQATQRKGEVKTPVKVQNQPKPPVKVQNESKPAVKVQSESKPAVKGQKEPRPAQIMQVGSKSPVKVPNDPKAGLNVRDALTGEIKEIETIKCPDCVRAFISKSALNKHLQTIHFKCSVCAKVLKTANECQVHVAAHEGVLRCEHCLQLVKNKADLETHLRHKHPQEIYDCVVCDSWLKSKEAYNTHLEELHPECEEMRLELLANDDSTCKICGKQYKVKGMLKRHMLRHADKPNTVFPCPHCTRKFNSNFMMKQHVYRLHKNVSYSCEKCGMKFKREEFYVLHMKQYHSGPYNCPECGLSHQHWKELSSHRLAEHNVGIDCSVCGAKFERKVDLMRHKNAEHRQEANLLCDVCGAGFVRRASMKSHLLQEHFEGNKVCMLEMYPSMKTIPEPCDICHEMLKTQVGLKLHYLNKHFGGKPEPMHEAHPFLKLYPNVTEVLICDHCGKMFSKMSNLKQHLQVHGIHVTSPKPKKEVIVSASEESANESDASEGGVDLNDVTPREISKSYKCPKHNCKLQFSRKAALQRHMSVHEVDYALKAIRQMEKDDIARAEEEERQREAGVFVSSPSKKPASKTANVPTSSPQKTPAKTIGLMSPSLGKVAAKKTDIKSPGLKTPTAKKYDNKASTKPSSSSKAPTKKADIKSPTLKGAEKTMPEKRGRGRPVKIEPNQEEEDNKTTRARKVSEPQPVVGKRGRPPKKAEEKEDGQSDRVPGKRGRPSKSTEKKLVVPVDKVAGKRGRPPKVLSSKHGILSNKVLKGKPTKKISHDHGKASNSAPKGRGRPTKKAEPLRVLRKRGGSNVEPESKPDIDVSKKAKVVSKESSKPTPKQTETVEKHTKPVPPQRVTPFQCKICGNYLSRAEHVVRHMKNVHYKNKKFDEEQVKLEMKEEESEKARNQDEMDIETFLGSHLGLGKRVVPETKAKDIEQIKPEIDEATEMETEEPQPEIDATTEMDFNEVKPEIDANVTDSVVDNTVPEIQEEQEPSDDLSNDINVAKYPCRECGNMYSTSSGILRHWKSKHSKLDITSLEDEIAEIDKATVRKRRRSSLQTRSVAIDETKVKQEVKDGNTSFRCNICHMLYSSANGIKKHFDIFHPMIKNAQENSAAETVAAEADVAPVTDDTTVTDGTPVTDDTTTSVTDDTTVTDATLVTDGTAVADSGVAVSATAVPSVTEVAAGVTDVRNIKVEQTDDEPSPSLHVCSICFRVHTEETNLSRHMVMKHNVRYEMSLNSNNDKAKYKCKYCSRTFLEESNMTRHVKMKHLIGKGYGKRKREYYQESNSRKYRCRICSKSFLTKGKLGAHEKNRHYLGKRSGKIDYKVKSMGPEDWKASKGTVRCDKCCKPFRLRRRMIAHKKSCHPYSPRKLCHSPFKQAVLDQANAMKKSKTVDTREYTCKVCKLNFTKHIHYKFHLRKHKQEKPKEDSPSNLYCALCDKQFTKAISYNIHLRQLHIHEMLNIPSSQQIAKQKELSSCVNQMRMKRKHSIEPDSAEEQRSKMPKLGSDDIVTIKTEAVEPEDVPPANNDENITASESIVEYFFCDDCKRTFWSKQKFMLHKKNSHPKTYAIELDRMVLQQLNTTEQVAGTREKVVDVLSPKKRSFSGPMKHKCEFCMKVHWTAKSFEEHMMAHHADEVAKNPEAYPFSAPSKSQSPKRKKDNSDKSSRLLARFDNATVNLEQLSAAPVVLLEQLPLAKMCRVAEETPASYEDETYPEMPVLTPETDMDYGLCNNTDEEKQTPKEVVVTKKEPDAVEVTVLMDIYEHTADEKSSLEKEDEEMMDCADTNWNDCVKDEQNTGEESASLNLQTGLAEQNDVKSEENKTQKSKDLDVVHSAEITIKSEVHPEEEPKISEVDIDEDRISSEINSSQSKDSKVIEPERLGIFDKMQETEVEHADSVSNTDLEHADTAPSDLEPVHTAPSEVEPVDIAPSAEEHADTVHKLETELADTAPSVLEHVGTAPFDLEHTDTAPSEVDHVDTAPLEAQHVDKASSEAEQTHVDKAPSEVEHVDTAPSDLEHVDIAPSDLEHVDTAPSEAEHVDTVPPEVENMDIAPSDLEHVDTAPPDAEDADEAPSEVKHADKVFSELEQADTAPAEVENVDTVPNEVEHALTTPTEVEHSDTLLKEVEHADSTPSDVEHADTVPAEEENADTAPLEVDHAGTAPIEHPDSLPTEVEHADTAQAEVWTADSYGEQACTKEDESIIDTSATGTVVDDFTVCNVSANGADVMEEMT